ncbi:hypothetical protein NQ317_016476 [Molorchus minor]|uniref:PTHB1 C-terminal helix bundle domain-containing protein n=1 Tax=Molorchus minor TaxID=1323400 RepID=A0ABQ9JAN9_9CUCU|nr:hypothetical protein NQ317_016476 [Molorchus minor]
MIFRLQKHCADKSDFKFSYSSTLPSNEFLLYVNNHFRKRQQAVKLQLLGRIGSTWFSISRDSETTCSKIQTENPHAIDKLEYAVRRHLYEYDWYEGNVGKTGKGIMYSSGELSCTLAVVNNLISLLNVDKDLKETLESVFCNSVQDVESQSWEDVIDASIKHLNQVFERINKKAKEAKDEPEQEFTADEGTFWGSLLDDETLSHVVKKMPSHCRVKERHFEQYSEPGESQVFSPGSFDLLLKGGHTWLKNSRKVGAQWAHQEA